MHLRRTEQKICEFIDRNIAKAKRMQTCSSTTISECFYSIFLLATVSSIFTFPLVQTTPTGCKGVFLITRITCQTSKNNFDKSMYRGAFFVWRAPILSWPRIMCSQVRMIIWQSIWSKLASWTYSGITLDIKVFSLWRTS